MEQNKIICVSCPIGCRMTVQSKDGKITSVIGNACPKGIKYAGRRIYQSAKNLTHHS
jgi:CxxC motif-containing protein